MKGSSARRQQEVALEQYARQQAVLHKTPLSYHVSLACRQIGAEHRARHGRMRPQDAPHIPQEVAR